MPRNKYPEETVQKILDAAMKTFLEKGYEQSTILDIVNAMGGLTRGAFYHHFKSKQEVLDALTGKLFFDDNPFDQVKDMNHFNGLQKLKWVFSELQMKDDYRQIAVPMMSLIGESPAFLKQHIEESRDIVSPLMGRLIEEGVSDGSIKIEHPKLFAELFTLMINVWMIPSIYPCKDEEEVWAKLDIIKNICEKMGLPIFDDEFIKLCDEKAIRLK